MPAGMETWGVRLRSARPAAGAGGGVHHLAEHRRAHGADLAAAAAAWAGRRARAGLRPAPGAGVAPSERTELDLLLDAPGRLLEGQAQVVAQVGADGWLTPTAGARRTLAEEPA